MASSIYIHIPFCKSICSYCDFCKMYYYKKYIKDYLNALDNEIKSKYKKELINTIYIGGGTPSCLSLDEVEYLFEIIKQFNVSKDLELSFEANILDINEELLKLLKNNNVNRLSIGIETVNSKFMSFLNRYNDKGTVIDKINLVKKYFSNYNLDLMYGFPNQSVEEVLDDLSFIVNLNPKHLSIYSLIIEEHTKIYIDGVKPIDDEIEETMYFKIIEYLKNKGYIHYEISNFAISGYESKHNQVYWNNEEYYGFGLGASGFIDNIRYTNTRSINKYLNNNYDWIKENISKSINMENELIFGLRKISGVNKKTFYKKYGINIDEIFDIITLVNQNMLIENEDYIYIPENKLYISNQILVNFIGGSKHE